MISLMAGVSLRVRASHRDRPKIRLTITAMNSLIVNACLKARVTVCDILKVRVVLKISLLLIN